MNELGMFGAFKPGTITSAPLSAFSAAPGRLSATSIYGCGPAAAAAAAARAAADKAVAAAGAAASAASAGGSCSLTASDIGAVSWRVSPKAACVIQWCELERLYTPSLLLDCMTVTKTSMTASSSTASSSIRTLTDDVCRRPATRRGGPGLHRAAVQTHTSIAHPSSTPTH